MSFAGIESRWRPKLLDVQFLVIFATLAICAVIGTSTVANFTIVSQENAILTREEISETRAAALGAAVAYEQGNRPGDSWRQALAPVIAVADRTGAALEVRDPGGPAIVRSSPGFATF